RIARPVVGEADDVAVLKMLHGASPGRLRAGGLVGRMRRATTRAPPAATARWRNPRRGDGARAARVRTAHGSDRGSASGRRGSTRAPAHRGRRGARRRSAWEIPPWGARGRSAALSLWRPFLRYIFRYIF